MTNAMKRSFWSDPYLWIHLSGLATVPLCLELCWLGLALGNPILPARLELLIIAAIGIIPILWMQLFRPFSIFSILLLGIKPEKLTQEQLKILSLFKNPSQRILALLAPILLLPLLWQIYLAAPIAARVITFVPEWRLLGLLVAAIAFLLVNLFVQVPVSVLPVLLTKEATFNTTQPYAVEKIRSDFSLPSWEVDRIFPPLFVQNKQSSAS